MGREEEIKAMAMQAHKDYASTGYTVEDFEEYTRDVLKWTDEHPNWISTKERLPEPHTTVLGVIGQFLPEIDFVELLEVNAIGEQFWAHACIDNSFDNDISRDITYWMPIPDFPDFPEDEQ